MKIIDLSMTIKNHWRWNVTQTFRHHFDRGDDFRTSILQIPAHAFTHVDTSLHCQAGGPTLDQLDVFSYSGPATVIDLTFIQPNQEITAEHIRDNAGHVAEGDVILLKTCWDTHYEPDSKEYWTEAPYISDKASIWLNSIKPRVIGFDFPQDYAIKSITRSSFTLEESTAHKHLLCNGVLFVEYLCNMSQISQEKVKFIALPLKLEGFEGGPVRAIAIED
ncbi:MAG: hypothetical protein H6Q68_396 [Firmicutes bacterium]|nr:hypothetical protein [Bacillota bacterium]